MPGNYKIKVKSMSEQEGVIKFQLDYAVSRFEQTIEQFDGLNAWRNVCIKLGLIGQDPNRYDGYGFGNISMRVAGVEPSPNGMAPFLISGTQTGGIDPLTLEHYALVTSCWPTENRVVAQGPWKPSSESMTHGVVYGLNPDIQCVIHVHSPHIWHAVIRQNLPATGEEVPYGTPAMAAAVQQLYRDTGLPKHKVFAMRGHADGVVVFGGSLADAGTRLVSTYVEAIQLIKEIPT